MRCVLSFDYDFEIINVQPLPQSFADLCAGSTFRLSSSSIRFFSLCYFNSQTIFGKMHSIFVGQCSHAFFPKFIPFRFMFRLFKNMSSVRFHVWMCIVYCVCMYVCGACILDCFGFPISIVVNAFPKEPSSIAMTIHKMKRAKRNGLKIWTNQQMEIGTMVKWTKKKKNHVTMCCIIQMSEYKKLRSTIPLLPPNRLYSYKYDSVCLDFIFFLFGNQLQNLFFLASSLLSSFMLSSPFSSTRCSFFTWVMVLQLHLLSIRKMPVLGNASIRHRSQLKSIVRLATLAEPANAFVRGKAHEWVRMNEIAIIHSTFWQSDRHSFYLFQCASVQFI